MMSELRVVNGELIYENESGMVGANPIMSEVMPFPETGSDLLGRASYDVELDGDVFTVKVFYKKRTGMYDVSITGYEVYAESKLLTTSYRYFGYGRDNRRRGSNDFIYKGSWYCLTDRMLSLTDNTRLLQYPDLDKPGIKLLKFHSSKAHEINEIVKDFDYDNINERKSKEYIRKLWGDENIDEKTIKW